VNTGRPLDGITSIKVKLALLVGTSVLAALSVAAIADAAGVAGWVSAPVTLAAALAVTQWLARGMTSPLREMTDAARRMAGGDYGQRVTTTSSDEVGQLARAFTAMATDLAGADLERRRLVATVSHELRTPLTAQRALLENLVDGVVRPDDAALRGALAQAERLSDLVGDLLDLSRIDAGAAPLALQEVRVAEVLARAADEVGLDGRPVLVRRRVDPADLRVTADPARLAQLVANLLDNAVRHSPPHAEVRLEAGTDGDGSWVLEVLDDGPGIPVEQAERVLERFGTGDDSGGGTGLGLAIARWVCELHGGRVEVVPTPPGGRGARLRATLPLHPRPARPTHLQTTTQPSPHRATPTPEPPVSTTAPAPSAPRAPATGPYGGGGPGPVETALGRLWPERDLGPRVRVLLAALGIGALAALTWPYRGFGLVTSVTMLLTGALMWLVARHRRDPWTVACGVLAALLALVVTLRDAGGVVTLSVLAGVTVAAVGLTRAHGLLAMLASGAAWPLSAVRGLPLLGRTLAATSHRRLLWPVLRTVAISVLALVVFGGLFATGDAVFGSWASALVPDLGWDTIVLRGFVLVLLAGVSLTGAYLAMNPPAVDVLRLPVARPTRRPWEWAVPVGVVVALFAVFLLAQATEMWGGLAYLRASGRTYAGYVHEGFGQLTVATFLTIVVVGVTMRVASRETPRDRLLLRGLVGLLCVFTLAVVASALYRMSLYQDAYGYTTLRVFVDGLELWFGLLVAMLLLAALRLSGAWVARAVLVSGAVFTLGFAVMNPDAWVAARNIDRYEATGRIDTLYLSSLSADAAPVLAQRLPAPMAACVTSAGVDREVFGTRATEDPLSWNLGRARADAAVDALPPPVGCDTYLSDDYRG
jgi:two-component system sensor histidine kinase BaeS